MSSDPISRISPTLAEIPAANFLLWLQSVKHNARAILADEYTYGLLHLVMDPVRFATLPGNVDANNVAIPPPAPARPPPLVGGASGGTVATQKVALVEYLRYQ